MPLCRNFQLVMHRSDRRKMECAGYWRHLRVLKILSGKNWSLPLESLTV